MPSGGQNFEFNQIFRLRYNIFSRGKNNNILGS